MTRFLRIFIALILYFNGLSVGLIFNGILPFDKLLKLIQITLCNCVVIATSDVGKDENAEPD